jgi:hypothetical protein
VNYHNKDRGDCLDYTLFPRNNLHPGQYNFDLLNQLYAGGPAPIDSVTTSGTSGSGNSTTTGGENGDGILGTINDIIITVVDNVSDTLSQFFGSVREHDVRRLRSSSSRRNLPQRDEEEDDDMSIPNDIQVQLEQVISFLEQTSDPEELAAQGAEILHSDKFSQSLQFNLGQGYTIRVSKLLVAPNED